MKPMTIQRIIGIILILCGVAAAWLTNWDITNLFIIAPLGLICLFSKENVIGIIEDNFCDDEEGDNDEFTEDPKR